jgi:CRP-like cAMP-binding protein
MSPTGGIGRTKGRLRAPFFLLFNFFNNYFFTEKHNGIDLAQARIQPAAGWIAPSMGGVMAQKIYSYLDQPENAFLLKTGTVVFEIREGERYKISGQNLIVGAGEILLQLDGAVVFRNYNFYQEDDAELVAIPRDNLANLIYKYNIGYNINYFQAQMLQRVNKIMGQRQKQLSSEEQEAQKLAVDYYKLAQKISEIGQQTGFRDIVAVGREAQNELVFKTGQIYAKENKAKTYHKEETKAQEFASHYEHEEIICEQGEEGFEMYILESGRIDVLVGETKVSQISEKGTVLGEIALLLGETRTATLQANGRVVLTKIQKDNLESFHAKHPDIFLHIGQTLARRIHDSFNYIHNLDEQIAQKNSEKQKNHFMQREQIEDKLRKLRSQISELYSRKKYEQLEPIVEQFDDPLLGL